MGCHDEVSSRTVDTHVAVLRRKLGHPMEEPGFIMTVAKAGDRLRECMRLSPDYGSRDACPATSCHRPSRRTSTSVNRCFRSNGSPFRFVPLIVASAVKTTTSP